MNMALLGLSLVIVSLTCVFYQSPSRLWRSMWRHLVSLKERRMSRGVEKEKEKDSETPAGTEKEDHEETEDLSVTPATYIPEITTPKSDDEVENCKTELHPPAKRKENPDETTPPPPTPLPIIQHTPPNPTPPPTTTPMPPIPTSTLSKPSPTPSTLMPPPPRPISNSLRQPTTTLSPPTTATHRIPTTGPLPNRGPPRGTSTSSLLPTTSTLPIPARPRRKVLLSPGHSPLDWAHLTRTSPNLSGVPHFQRVTPSQLAENNGRKGNPAWSAYRGRVYNLGPYAPFHPGGEGELRRGAGGDGEKLFMEVHPWVNWENMLGGCLVGVLVAEEGGGGLEEMD